MATSRLCAVADCDKRSRACGFCPNHYFRFRKHGDPLGGRVSPGTLLRWLEERVGYSGDDCLTWPFGARGKGYGVLSVSGQLVSASRHMCRMAHGEPPTEEHESAHSCGLGHEGCVNPRHLRWATRSENAEDRWGHGTMGNGANHGAAKLTDADVREIRSLAGHWQQRDIARRFGVSQPHVCIIIRRRAWAWLD